MSIFKDELKEGRSPGRYRVNRRILHRFGGLMDGLMEELMEKEENVFGRRHSIQRTPPTTDDETARKKDTIGYNEGQQIPATRRVIVRGRSGSLTDVPPGELFKRFVTGGVKKKRKEASEEEESDGEKVANKAKEAARKIEPPDALAESRKEVRHGIRDMEKITSALKTLVGENKNTQVDIKKRVAELGRLMESITRKVENWERLEAERKASLGKTKETRDAQTQAGTKIEEMDKTLAAIRKGGSYTEYGKVKEEEWPKEAYRVVNIAPRGEDPMMAPWDWDLALMTSKDLKMKGPMEGRFRSRYQGVEELKAQEAGLGEIAWLGEKRIIPGKTREDSSEIERRVYYIMTMEEEGQAPDPEAAFEGLKRLRISMVGRKKQMILLCVGETAGLGRVRKMAKFALAGTDLQVRLLGGSRGGVGGG